MKPDAYDRNIAARAFDVARYLLFWGIPTGVGQVTSIRTLERQIRRLKASPYDEVRELAEEIAIACTAPARVRSGCEPSQRPVAPTLAQYVDADAHAPRCRSGPRPVGRAESAAALHGRTGNGGSAAPAICTADIAATLLYPVTDRPFRELYELAAGWSDRTAAEVIDVALQSRTRAR